MTRTDLTTLEAEFLAACRLQLAALKKRVRPGFHSLREWAEAAARGGATEQIKQEGEATLALLAVVAKAEGH